MGFVHAQHVHVEVQLNMKQITSVKFAGVSDHDISIDYVVGS